MDLPIHIVHQNVRFFHRSTPFLDPTRILVNSTFSEMALAPRFAGQKFTTLRPKAVHTLELCKLASPKSAQQLTGFADLDYVCPFSAKMFNTVYNHVLPTIEKQYSDKVEIIFRQQIQPWHPSSTLVHEAGVAILRLAPNKFYDFSSALFNAQKDYFDVSVVNEARNATYRRLAKLAAQSTGVKEDEVYGLLEISDKPEEDGSLNSGNKVTDDVKVLVKTSRMQGVHVTPTVVFNGVVENGISSSFTGDQWQEWLQKNIS